MYRLKDYLLPHLELEPHLDSAFLSPPHLDSAFLSPPHFPEPHFDEDVPVFLSAQPAKPNTDNDSNEMKRTFFM